MKIHIKNMHGGEDVALVKSILEELDIQYEPIKKPGEVVLALSTNARLIAKFKARLEEHNFHIIFDRKNILTEQVKHLLYKMFEDDTLPEENYSVFIARHMNLNYNYVANTFSEIEGISIEHFIIEQKISKAKLLLQNTDFNISQIADILHYSSIGHFSNQFKKLTGQNPTFYKKALQKAVL